MQNTYPFGKQGIYNIQPAKNNKMESSKIENLTIAEWYEKLPEPYRAQAIKNAKLHPYAGAENKRLPSLFFALSMGFYWHKTEEGVSYWFDLHTRVEKGEFEA